MREFGLTITAVLITGTFAFAHSGAMGIVKERMDGMGQLGKSMKAISEQVKGADPVDIDAVKAAAQVIRDHSGQAMLDQFPKGSLDKPSEARAEIWQDWARFSALANQLNLQAEGLAMAAGNPVSGKQPAPKDNRMLMDYAGGAPDEVFALIGQTCGSCHKDFRLKK